MLPSRRRARQVSVLTALAGGCLLLTGCGGASVAPVSGQVTLDSAPLADVFIVFQPREGTPEQASQGKTDAEGRFVLTLVNEGGEGALVGQHLVRMTTVAPDAMDDERSKLPVDRVPRRYQREPLSFDVPAEGTTEANFDLKSS